MIDDADDHLLAELSRHGGDAEINRPALHQRVDVAVLWKTPLGDIQVGHDLDTAGDRRVHLIGRHELFKQTPVNAVTDAKTVIIGFDVDV